MSKVTESLLPAADRRFPPPSRSPRGNYPHNVIEGYFWNAQGNAQFAQGDLVTMLVFAQDFPVATRMDYWFNSVFNINGNIVGSNIFFATTQISAGGMHHAGNMAWLSTWTAAGVTTTQDQTLEGELIATVNGVVGVNGYLYQAIVPDTQWRDGSGGGAPFSTAIARATFICESGVVKGAQRTGVGADTIQTPIFLRSTLYTEEIRAADNVYDDGSGVQYKVVGLYESA
jgi:hypothetical protein